MEIIEKKPFMLMSRPPKGVVCFVPDSAGTMRCTTCGQRNLAQASFGFNAHLRSRRHRAAAAIAR